MGDTQISDEEVEPAATYEITALPAELCRHFSVSEEKDVVFTQDGLKDPLPIPFGHSGRFRV